jgi:hypothetical protein
VLLGARVIHVAVEVYDIDPVRADRDLNVAVGNERILNCGPILRVGD